MERSGHSPRVGIAPVHKLWPVCVALFAVIVMVVPLVAGGVRAAAAESSSRSREVPSPVGVSGLIAPAHQKYVKSNGDGTYDLTLNVRGDVAESARTVHQPVDVVLILDKSGSMRENGGVKGKTRWEVVKEAATVLTRRLLTPENSRLPHALQTRMSAVFFDNTAYCGKFPLGRWSVSAEELISTFGQIEENRSTNWEDGLRLGNEQVKKGRAGVPKHIVLLTDGMPTFRNTPMGYEGIVPTLQEKPSSFPNHPDYKNNDGARRLLRGGQLVYGNGALDYKDRCYRAAVDEAQRRAGDARLFAVSAGGDVSNEKMQLFAEEVGGQFFDGSNPDKLREAFDDIVRQIVTTSWRYRRVEISDELSEYVIHVDEGSGAKYTWGAIDSRGNHVSAEADSALKSMNVSYDPTSKRFKIGFDDGVMLTGGTTYWAKITVKPTDVAHKHYVTHGGKYPHTGEDGTDAPGSRTSSNQPGFHSNKGRATLTYMVVSLTGGKELAGDQQTTEYPHPVVQIRPATLTLAGKVDNTYAGKRGARASHWKLSALDKSGAGIALTAPSESVGASGMDQMATRGMLVVPGTYTLRQQADSASKYQHFSGYSEDGWLCADDKGETSDLLENGQVTVGAGQNVTCTANFRAKPGGIAWSKVDERDTTKLLRGSQWSLFSTDVPGFEGRKVSDNGEHDADSADGRLAVADLAWGEYELTETQAPEGYQRLDGALKVKVLPEAGEMTQESFTVKAGDGGKVANHKVAVKPKPAPAKPVVPVKPTKPDEAPKPAEPPKRAEPAKPTEPAKPAEALAPTGAWVTGGVAVIAFGLAAALAVRLVRKWIML
ncbi:DUF7604 domain-containing protein [Bifidobacterium panos]|uniref:Prespore-cell-inducing factor n=1 Tax=Bifidobacterium panos TaxID=2675321 RepID=A0ABX1SXT4_9BIFI|nr:VWA domain-containing protein [Bifidobacterium sp. DSM 109963]NMN02170.1 prespore-cell-inducing factor [Bifidobacterium sp. DSM 109963]